ncbi:RNA-dependent ATPase [Glutinoglossum americanum]|uniref:RNA helicase n=1 Tax=Glutinoglossum americanum TaxID=1670608 RepID=A0A9P8I4A1_9PEZI|nr:RNA-dependent ATPase [Glutinoglossum americanum]
MAKRLLDEATSENGDSARKKRKELRKEKTHKKTVHPLNALQGAPEAGRVTGDVKQDMTEEEGRGFAKSEKRKRKELKKLEKLQLCGQNGRIVPQEPATGRDEEDTVETAAKKAARKAARKARRQVERAERKSKRETGVNDDEGELEESQTQTPETTESDSVPSIVQTTTHTPEPSAATKTLTTEPTCGYSEDPALSSLAQATIDSFLSTNFIAITDPTSSSPSLRPIVSFKYLPVVGQSQLAPFKSFSSPTPIQAAAWPSIFAGRDVIGVAETGSGKTLAFAVPCIRYITSLTKSRKSRGAKAVVVSPTRELALQIYEQIVKLADPAGLEVVCVYGGVQKEEQRKALKTASIIVATPGRLNDLISEGAADLSKVGYLVLDEADRMLDKGFEDAIREIIKTTPPTAQRQTLMFTATWPPSVRELAGSFMKSPVKIAIGDNPTGDLRANARIVQKVEVVDPRGKEFRLLQLLREHQHGAQKNDRILVFCLYKKEATRVEMFLKSKGLRVAGIHGDLSQPQRTASLEAFKSGRVPLLVATDVAARGLDIPAVKLVINVTFPLTVEDYVHRIGRTGRAGKEGLAITLFTEHDKAQSGALINVLRAANQPVPEELLKFGTTVKKKGHEAYGAFYKEIDGAKTATKITFDD